MTKAIQLIIRVPFAGFYCSKWADIIDSCETRHVEYEYEEGPESEQPKAIRLSEAALSELLTRHSDYSIGYHKIARDYVEGFSDAASDLLDLPLGLSFSDMSSPREYNFETDRLFAYIPLKVVRQLFAKSKANDHATLGAVIKDSFTFRDGFIPHYSNDLGEWLDKPLVDWDHNELCTLLSACLTLADADEDEFEWNIYYPMAEQDYKYWEPCVDWGAFKAACDEARQDKLQDIEDELEDWERAEIEARADWRTGDVISHPDQTPLL